MGAPSTDRTMPTATPKSWKSRLSGRRPSPETRRIETTHNGVEVEDLKVLENGGTSSKSARFKKKMSGRFRHLLPISPNARAIKNVASDESPSNPQTPTSAGDETLERGNRGNQDPKKKKAEKKSTLFAWQDALEERHDQQLIRQKQLIKERDGFCRNVDSYDGSVIIIDGKPTYELGNYLGGGVAGVVYEGNRLLPSDQYPVRTGVDVDHIVPMTLAPQHRSTFSCMDTASVVDSSPAMHMQRSTLSMITAVTDPMTPPRKDKIATDECAIETTTDDHVVLVDHPDAPSRSMAAALAARSASQWFMEETVAVKILNPVGFRLLSVDQTKIAVVVKEGLTMSKAIQSGQQPMQDKHVWWIVNPSSRNLQTLQRYNLKNKDGTMKKTRDVDRGTSEKGLRLSLVAAYMDNSGELKELPLTRCIEVWGHVPFGASDTEFEDMMEALERINAGYSPVTLPPSRLIASSSSTAGSMNDISIRSSSINIQKERTGLFRAVIQERSTVFCESLNAYIALPAVPPKYLRWLRQRRAATKEIRNMMLIGRHRNVVHLYEVLEFIQESKSTMFLVLELVRGGELFDLISNGANSEKRGWDDKESEKTMRKFFQELASGIYYCHANGIAHRDLKPENLLVHNGPGKESTLKIADFGLSAVFELGLRDSTSVVDSLASPMVSPIQSPNRMSGRGDVSLATVDTSPSLVEIDNRVRSNSIHDSISAFGASALTFLTCGAVDDVAWCAPNDDVADEEAPSFALRRMTSVVGSPHYVAPEIIMQTDERGGRKKKKSGYDGTKADVWSAGVILYAMLFRSLPFGEDLLRCPRYQSFRKWYEEARACGTRRSTGLAALNPYISDADCNDQLGPHWFFPAETSRESRDLIVAMLNPDPDERLSIDMVLQHPWLINMPGEVEFRKFDD